MQIIDNSNKLIQYCNKIKDYDFITLDTEFLREKTYFSKLCLIQISTPDLAESAIIDPLSDIDLSPLFEILDNNKITKVLHSPSQDLEIFYNLTGKVPKNVFDTQIGASSIGLGEQVSYDALVKKICKKQLDKGVRFTDWSIRPLNKSQLNYAINDVTYLVEIYKYIISEIERLNRKEWIKKELDKITNEKTYQIKPLEAYKRIKFRTNNRKVLAKLREISKWRELSAIKVNVPRKHFIKDETIIDIASSKIKSSDDLSRIRNFPKSWLKSERSDEIIAIIEKVNNMPQSDYPEIIKIKPLNIGQKASIDLLKSLLKECAKKHSVSPFLIAKQNDLENFINNPEHNEITKGWKLEVFGEKAIKLINGDMALTIKNQQLEFISV